MGFPCWLGLNGGGGSPSGGSWSVPMVGRCCLLLLLLLLLRAIAAAAGEFSIARLKNSFSKIMGAMVFNRDMFMDVQLLADLNAIRGRKQQQIDDNNKRSNKGRIDHNYQIGEMVKLKVYDPTKLQERFKGPYRITQVFTNGTVHLQIKQGISTPINIRKIEPYKGEL